VTVSPRLAMYNVLPTGTIGVASDEPASGGLGVTGVEPAVRINAADCSDCAAAGTCRNRIPKERRKAATVTNKLKRRTVNLPNA
jgi:hypothetical protein